MKTYKEIIEFVNNQIDKIDWTKSPKGLYEPIGYILSLGGKRIRPVLTLMTANLYTENIQLAVKPALGLEIFHNFTLLHDDIMDRADMRRGNPTVHKKWCDNTAILSGDVMQIEAYKWISEVPENKLKTVLYLFSKMAEEVCEGQQLDMEFEKKTEVPLTKYLEMIKLKTAVLLATACQIGAEMGNATKQDAENLYDFGLNLGMAFQLKDDLLDVYGDANFGKKIGGDILCNKKTFLLINALNTAKDELKIELLQWLENESKEQENEKISAVTNIYNNLNIKTLTEKAINDYVDKAHNSLEKVSVSKSQKKELSLLLEKLSTRID